MKKSEIQDLLRKNRIFNNYEFLRNFAETKIDDVSIEFYASTGMRVKGTKIYSPSHETDPGAHWMNNKCQFFIGDKSSTMKKAMVWASEKYKVKEWKPSPFGGKIPDTVFARLKKFLDTQKG